MSIDARSAVIRQLAGAYDAWAELEQMLVAEGRYVESQGAHEYALRVLRAFRAEADDPGQPLDYTYDIAVTYSSFEPEDSHPHVLAIPGCPRCEARRIPHG